MPVIGIDKKVLTQVCIIVRDVEASTARYAEILGIDMSPNFQTTRLHDHTHATYYGQPTDARAKLSALDIGHLQFELLQPLDPPSSWGDFLDQHGEGIHHVAFFVPKADVVAASFKEYGYTVTQQGLFTGQTGTYTYLDTDKDLAVVVELLEHFGGSPELNGPPFPADKGLGTDIVCQVGIVVNDIERTARRYSEVLGLPLPPIIQTLGYSVSKTTYKGQPSEATAKLAFFSTGQVQIELIEPDDHPSTWRDFLDRNGEGAHHIAFQVADTQRAIDYLAQFGISVTQQGLYTDASGVYTYMDSQQQLGTTIELLESFKR
jgi:catechol 2,3-dioxygenase-like lactoylglutathione lyase family enzyme